MKQISGKQMCSLLIKKGWQLKRVNGSHHVFLKIGHTERISVPVHGNEPLKKGLLLAIMKIAGFTESEL